MVSPHILALDIGEKRIGVAIAEISIPFARPLTTLETEVDAREVLAKLLRQHHVQKVVIGRPRNQGGATTAQTAKTQQILTELSLPHEIDVNWQDESLTSVKAEEELKNRSKPYEKGDIDALAAAFILEDYINQRGGRV